jgi:hypothetical protein
LFAQRTRDNVIIIGPRPCSMKVGISQAADP